MLQLRPGMDLKSKWKKCEKSSKKNNEGRLAALGGEHYKATVSNNAKQTSVIYIGECVAYVFL